VARLAGTERARARAACMYASTIASVPSRRKDAPLVSERRPLMGEHRRAWQHLSVLRLAYYADSDSGARALVSGGKVSHTAAAITGPELAKATTATIRRKLINVPARIASSDGSPCTLPTAWPWQNAWTERFTRVCGPPPAPTT
jgi:uncharacterized phage-associated protein